ncbi:hypothetical protein VNO77_27189 [Canavalia gladiata]|uniref:Uncharacterized protein n=1 Tax=Canavalia gladiata TaxID=3824 RepID=A0AAN9KUY0_CANGL
MGVTLRFSSQQEIREEEDIIDDGVTYTITLLQPQKELRFAFLTRTEWSLRRTLLDTQLAAHILQSRPLPITQRNTRPGGFVLLDLLNRTAVACFMKNHSRDVVRGEQHQMPQGLETLIGMVEGWLDPYVNGSSCKRHVANEFWPSKVDSLSYLDHPNAWTSLDGLWQSDE